MILLVSGDVKRETEKERERMSQKKPFGSNEKPFQKTTYPMIIFLLDYCAIWTGFIASQFVSTDYNKAMCFYHIQ